MGKIIQIIKRRLVWSAALSTVLSIAQAQELAQIQKSFEQAEQNVLHEKVFLHTDKSAYVAGDLLWFKAYCIDATTHKPLNISKVLYVEVLDKSNAALIQTKISLNNGSGSGSISIPVSFNNGNYRIRAYTNWMKNFNADYYFSKTLTIINTLKSPEEIKQPATSYDVQFFPEGGNLVNGLHSNIGFKVVDQSGRGVAIKGAVINQKNDTVARFQSLKFGMGHFDFTPAEGNTYKAVIKSDGIKSFVKDLPVIANKGYNIELVDAGAQNIEVTINSTEQGPVFLFVHTGQLTKLAQTANIVNGRARFVINKTKLDEGVSHLTVFNSAKQPVCERLYFKRPKQKLSITSVADMASYGSRKKVNVNTSLKDASGKPVDADLSMAVLRLDSLQNIDNDDIISYLWLSSDLRGYIESPGYYLKDTTVISNQAVDNLMLTQGWQKFKWTKIEQDKPAAFAFLPEYTGHVITAKATNSASTPASNIIAFLAVPGKRVQLYTAKSNTEGKLFFNTKQLFGPGEVIVQPAIQTDTTVKIDVLSPFSEQYSTGLLPAFNLYPALQHALEEESLSMQVQNIYAGSKLKQFYTGGIDSSAFYQPYKSWNLDDYTRFRTLEEVLREYIFGLNVFRSDNKFSIRMIDQKGLMYDNPLVIMDGVPIFNMDKALAVDPLKIKKIEMVNERYYWGPSVYEGILNFTSYKGDLGGIELDPHAVVIDYEGMQLQREFYSPVYNTDAQLNSRMPDFRSLLYWSPNVTAEKVSFYTSDMKGKYIGIVQGISTDGQPAAQTFSFDVK
ncbi:hypothetical protein ACFQZX_16195 [Mucilaginibacter litoreus]|uniref:MG2 domain-containing protein n=1 Tax=Mucilaginibacter litoreus TaxID=1048221 RepID=A0ABW3AXQ1_9SPHI